MRGDRLTIGSVCIWGSEADVAHLGRMWSQALCPYGRGICRVEAIGPPLGR